jgi:hypothetical protein
MALIVAGAMSVEFFSRLAPVGWSAASTVPIREGKNVRPWSFIEVQGTSNYVRSIGVRLIRNKRGHVLGLPVPPYATGAGDRERGVQHDDRFLGLAILVS